MIGIIGGTGFIGLNLCSYLQRHDQPCRTFSRNGLLLDPSSVYFADLSRVEHIKGDFADKKAVREFVRSCRSIVVLVAHLLPSSSPEEIRGTISSFGPAFVELLEGCSHAAVEQVVFISSGGTIYGENVTGKPTNEEHAMNPHCAYGSFCAFLEQLLHTFHNQFRLPYTILRLGNPYGLLKRTNRNQGIMDYYIRSARAGRPFAIFGDGNEVRDYIYIDDVSKVITRVINSPPPNAVFNVGTGVGHTSQEVIASITKHFNLPVVPLLYKSRRIGDIRCSVLDMAKFEASYGLGCHTSLDEGLRRYAELEALSR